MFKKCLGPVCDGRSSRSRIGSSVALARERRLWTPRDDWNIHGRTCKLLYFLFSDFYFNFSHDHLAYGNDLFYSVPLRHILKSTFRVTRKKLLAILMFCGAELVQC